MHSCYHRDRSATLRICNPNVTVTSRFNFIMGDMRETILHPELDILFKRVPPTAPPWSPAESQEIYDNAIPLQDQTPVPCKKRSFSRLYVATVHPQPETSRPPLQISHHTKTEPLSKSHEGSPVKKLADLNCITEKLKWSKDPLPSEVPSPRHVIDDEPEPGPPPLELMDKVPGYENVTFTPRVAFPPNECTRSKSEEQPGRTFISGSPIISEVEARQLLQEYATRKCCFSTKAIGEIAITKMENTSAYYYKLESFTERREVVWTTVPYKGSAKADISLGEPPEAWSIPCAPPAYFMNYKTRVDVPYTASIKTCHVCGGSGRKLCYCCTGNGWENCYYCQGLGHKILLQGETERCYQCHGTGRKRCWKCEGEGMISCKACGGSGQIRCCIQLVVTWTNNSNEEIAEESTVSNEKLKLVTGQIVFQEEQPEIWPIVHFHNVAVNKTSGKLLDFHMKNFTNEKCLMQRHQVKVVPVTTAYYKWRNESRFFSIYGIERVVYAPNFPRFGRFSCNFI